MPSNRIELTPPALQETPQLCSHRSKTNREEEELNLRGMRRAAASEASPSPPARPADRCPPTPLRFRLRFGLIELQLRPFGLYFRHEFLSGYKTKAVAGGRAAFTERSPTSFSFARAGYSKSISTRSLLSRGCVQKCTIPLCSDSIWAAKDGSNGSRGPKVDRVIQMGLF